MINYSSFLAATINQNEFLTETKLKSLFEYFDVSKNGYITI